MMMASESNEKHGRPATVLVVDDDEGVRAVAVAALSERFNVIEAESGKEALDVLAETNEVDVVVTDVVMPGVSGLHVARGAQDRRPPVKVLMMSAYAAGLVDTQLPASGFLSKPSRLRELEKAVESLLDD
jgi:two-component system cell cycle sensor histidine kinase/response regulator CckA